MQGIEVILVGTIVTEPRKVKGVKATYWEFNIECRGLKEKPTVLTVRSFENNFDEKRQVKEGERVACYCTLLSSKLKTSSDKSEFYLTYILIENILLLGEVRSILRTDRYEAKTMQDLNLAYKQTLNDMRTKCGVEFSKISSQRKGNKDYMDGVRAVLEYMKNTAYPVKKAVKTEKIKNNGEVN